MARRKKKKTVGEWISEKSTMLKSIGYIITATLVIGGFAISFNDKMAVANEAKAEVAEVKKNYAPMQLVMSIQERVDKNTDVNRLQGYESSKAYKEKRKDKLKDKYPNIRGLSEDDVNREEYDELTDDIKDLKKKIKKLENKIEDAV